jgi:predicted Zn-dependent protease with MMP-like domain
LRFLAAAARIEDECEHTGRAWEGQETSWKFLRRLSTLVNFVIEEPILRHWRPVRSGLVRLSRREFEALVAEALDAIPEGLARLMDNVVVVVEDWPTDEQRSDHETLFGYYEGTALTERSPLYYSGVLPDRITIFRGPLCEACETEDDLIDEVYVTVVHEVAHHFGISDERLEELGWD